MKLLTVTWSADWRHFELLRHSLGLSRLADVPHEVVVQTEDLNQFREFAQGSVQLRSSADVLPPAVETRRLEARHWQARLGRRSTIIAGSLARRIGWPDWVRYTGWHTQQLCKLAAVAASDEETVVVLDSDLIASPWACPSDFAPSNGSDTLCYQRWVPDNKLMTKNANWQRSAHRLLDLPMPSHGPFDVYYDTPFIMHPGAVRELFDWLESTYHCPWWQALLSQPPRQWSEFGTYRLFLRHRYGGQVEWRNDDLVAYLYDASDVKSLVSRFRQLLLEQDCHYITIHSQSSGRHSWTPEDYHIAIKQCLELIRAKPSPSHLQEGEPMLSPG